MRKYFFNLSISAKLQFVFWLLFFLVFASMAILLFYSQRAQLIAANDQLLRAHVEDLVRLLELQNKEKTVQVQTILRVAEDLLDSAGLEQTDSLITMQAVHQLTKVAETVEVPVWKIAGEVLHGENFKLVDKATSLAGGTVTIFQKIPQGYLRISTTVRNKEGQRAVGTYIANDSPVAQAIERGETFRGRAFVVDDWYQTVYQPIRLAGRTQGILYAGIKEKDMGFLKNIILSRKYFDTGFSYCLDKKGEFVIHPFREGENAATEPHISQLLDSTQGTVSYQTNGITHKVYYSYFAPFEMYMAIDVPETEMYQKQINRIRLIVTAGLVVSLLMSFLGTRLISRHVATPISSLTRTITEMAKGRQITLNPSERKDEIGQMIQALLRLAEGLGSYARFARSIGKGDFRASFHPLSQEDELGLSLLDMRDKLEAAAVENQQRNWANDGLAQFAVLLREQNANLEHLADRVLSKLIKFVDASQGTFFIAEQTPEGQTLLNMKACYAYGRKKYVKSSFMPGEGLIGQTFLERDKVVLRQVPPDFIQIGSGLGQAKPGFVVILPIQIREEVLGIMEIASFKPLADYQIAFLEQVASAAAAAIIAVKVSERTSLLLHESQMKAQQLAAQEEKMRQNLEDLEATQEEMRRNEKCSTETISRLQKEIEALKITKAG